MFRKVDRLSCVRYGSARYSVPTTAIGRQVEVRVHTGELSVLTCLESNQPQQLLACHPLVAPGEVCIVDAHYPGPRSATPARAVRARTTAEKAFLALGPAAEAFLTGAAAADRRGWAPSSANCSSSGTPTAQPALREALTRATAFGRWRAEDVRSILANGHAPVPRLAGDALVVTLPTVPTRPLADYAIAPSGDAS